MFSFMKKPLTLSITSWIVLLILVSFSVPVISQTAADFTGTFASSETGIILAIDKKSSKFEGEFTVQNQRFSCEATFSQGGLSGVYNDNGRKIAFTLVKFLGEYYLTTEGVNIPMKRNATAPKNAQPATSQARNSSAVPSTPTANGQRLSNAFLGYAFNAPNEWQMKEENGSFAFGRGDQQVIITVAPHNYNDLSSLRNDTKNVQDPNSNTYLNVRFDPYSETGAWVIFNGTIKGQPYIIATIALISPYGGGINIAVISPTSLYNESLSNTVRAMANTVSFTKPQTSALALQWKNRLKGKELLYLATGNGLSDKFSIDLCGNGQFAKKENSSYLSQTYTDNFTYAGRSGNEGRWDIMTRGNTPILVLRANDGQVFQYEISPRQASNELGMNGKRYFVRQSQFCQ